MVKWTPLCPASSSHGSSGSTVWNGSGNRRDGEGAWGRCVTVYNEARFKGEALTVRPGLGIDRLPAGFGHVKSNRFHTCRIR